MPSRRPSQKPIRNQITALIRRYFPSNKVAGRFMVVVIDQTYRYLQKETEIGCCVKTYVIDKSKT